MMNAPPDSILSGWMRWWARARSWNLANETHPWGPVVMLLADRATVEQTIGWWSPRHLSEHVVTQTLLITFVAAAKREVKYIPLKKIKIQKKMLNFCSHPPAHTDEFKNNFEYKQRLLIFLELFYTYKLFFKDPTYARWLTSSPCDKIYSINILFIEWHILKGPLTIKATWSVSCIMN